MQVSSAAPAHPQSTSKPQTSRVAALESWLGRHAGLAFLVLTLLASARIVGTYPVFSHTVDEPAHIACGMQWLSEGIYEYEAQHPPLARVASAIGPYLAGERTRDMPEKWAEGLAILGGGDRYERNLTLARLGILPFFWIASWVVYAWCRRYSGEAEAALSVLLFTSLPPVLAHAGLATTDMALTAMLGAAFLAGMRWQEKPGAARSLGFGALAGLAVLSKFSALPFLPLALLTGVAVQSQRMRATPIRWSASTYLQGLALAALAAFTVVWAGYRFSFGPTASGLRLPFPELFNGIAQVAKHNEQGHYIDYLLGQRRSTGWWYYYLVALGVKTPLAFIALVAAGLIAALRHTRYRRGVCLALAFSGSILLFCTGSNINIGVRHVLPVYLGFSVIAATGLVFLLRQGHRRGQWLALVLAGAAVVPPALAHPDYLAYFNLLAGPHPEQVLVDSDLDWGQDLKRLAARLKAVGATQVALTPTMKVDLAGLGFPAVVPNDFLNPVPGWNATRLTLLQVLRADLRAEHPEIRIWPDYVPPTERIGKSILLWYFDPEDLRQAQGKARQLQGAPR